MKNSPAHHTRKTNDGWLKWWSTIGCSEQDCGPGQRGWSWMFTPGRNVTTCCMGSFFHRHMPHCFSSRCGYALSDVTAVSCSLQGVLFLYWEHCPRKPSPSCESRWYRQWKRSIIVCQCERFIQSPPPHTFPLGKSDYNLVDLQVRTLKVWHDAWMMDYLNFCEDAVTPARTVHSFPNFKEGSPHKKQPGGHEGNCVWGRR